MSQKKSAIDAGPIFDLNFQDRLRRWLFDQLPEALTVKDTAGRYVLINKAAVNLLGVDDPQALRDKTDFDILPVEQAALLDDAEMAVRAGQILCFEEDALDPATGKVRRLQTTKLPLTDDSGEFVGVASLRRDLAVSEEGLRRADEGPGLEEVLERERELLRTIIDSIPAKIYAKDIHSRFIACNVLVASEMGTTTAQAIGKTDFDFFPQDMAEGFFTDEQAVLQSGQPLLGREELVLDRLSGTMRES